MSGPLSHGRFRHTTNSRAYGGIHDTHFLSLVGIVRGGQPGEMYPSCRYAVLQPGLEGAAVSTLACGHPQRQGAASCASRVVKETFGSIYI